MRAVRAVLFTLAFALSYEGLADSTAYTQVASLQVERGTLRFRQILDQSLREFPASFASRNAPNPHLFDHRPIFLELWDTASDQLLFRKPSPNLTYLWIGPDSQYFVGLSKVKLNNRVQLVVYDREGVLVHAEHITPSGACLSTGSWADFHRRYPEASTLLVPGRRLVHAGYFIDYEQMGMPGKLGGAWEYLYQRRCASPYSNRFHSTVSNFVFWFNEADPGLELAYGDGTRPVGLLIREPEWPACDRNISENRGRCDRATRRFLVRFHSSGR